MAIISLINVIMWAIFFSGLYFAVFTVAYAKLNETYIGFKHYREQEKRNIVHNITVSSLIALVFVFIVLTY